MSYSKEYPSGKPTFRQVYNAPDGPPPSYEQGYSTNPIRDPSPPVSYGSRPPSGYDNSQSYTSHQTSQYYSYGQPAGPPKTSSDPYLAPPQHPLAQRSSSPNGSSSSRAGGFMQSLTGSGPENLLNPPPTSIMRGWKKYYANHSISGRRRINLYNKIHSRRSSGSQDRWLGRFSYAPYLLPKAW